MQLPTLKYHLWFPVTHLSTDVAMDLSIANWVKLCDTSQQKTYERHILYSLVFHISCSYLSTRPPNQNINPKRKPKPKKPLS